MIENSELMSTRAVSLLPLRKHQELQGLFNLRLLSLQSASNKCQPRYSKQLIDIIPLHLPLQFGHATSFHVKAPLQDYFLPLNLPDVLRDCIQLFG